MIPLSREVAKFLDLLKFRHEDSVVSLKDVKEVLKVPYKVFNRLKPNKKLEDTLSLEKDEKVWGSMVCRGM